LNDIRRLTYVAVSAFMLVGFGLIRHSTWQGNIHLHTSMEVVAALLALIVGSMALVRFYAQKNTIFLFIGTGLLDGYHALVTSSYFSAHFPLAILWTLFDFGGLYKSTGYMIHCFLNQS
jgi:hypothetical protein